MYVLWAFLCVTTACDRPCHLEEHHTRPHHPHYTKTQDWTLAPGAQGQKGGRAEDRGPGWRLSELLVDSQISYSNPASSRTWASFALPPCPLSTASRIAPHIEKPISWLAQLSLQKDSAQPRSSLPFCLCLDCMPVCAVLCFALLCCAVLCCARAALSDFRGCLL